MPSEIVHRILGEADVRRPSDIRNELAPTMGSGTGIKWRVHRVLGIQPINIDADIYEEWLNDLAMANVDSDYATNEVPVEELMQMNGGHDQIQRMLDEAKEVARRVYADVVAFTTDVNPGA